MTLSLEIAKRYLLGKKSTQAINIITWVSVLGLSIGTAALILILSVFNGFEKVLGGLFDAFNAELKVVPTSGKYFEMDEDQLYQLRALPEIHALSATLEEVALFDYKNIQEVGIIKGVDTFYTAVTHIDSSLRAGKYKLKENQINYGVVGSGLGAKLSLHYNDPLNPVTVYMPARQQRGPMSRDYNTIYVYSAGIFSAGSDSDNQYIITNLEEVSYLLELESTYTALEIKSSSGSKESRVREAILNLLGDGFTIKNKYEQDETFFKVMNTEKWVSFFIAGFIMLIIAFNMVGSLWMLVLEKKLDMSILQAIGYTRKGISGLVILQGILISITGLLSGICLALILYFLQKNYGLISIPAGFLIDSYPIELKWNDFLLVSTLVLIIGILASLLPAIRASRITPYVRLEQ